MNALALITTALLVVVGVVYIRNNNIQENFWMTPSRSVKVEKMFRDCSKPDFYQIPNYQSLLSPRFSNVGYGANLLGNMPNYSMVGVPYDPLMNTPRSLGSCAESSAQKPLNLCQNIQMSHPEVEPYCDGWQSTNIVGGLNKPLIPHTFQSGSGFSDGNYQETLNLALDAGASAWPTSTVQEPNRATVISDDGQITQPIIYDRYIYANKSSRQRGAGDPIRGDLPIVPVSGNWFIPSQANSPSINLQQGAMNVMGGVNNETSNSLANLIWNASGGTETTIGGVDMSKTMMTHQVYGAGAAAQGDVVVTSFP
jgi:hypothetical protein